MESLYVCLFSNGHIKVGRSIDPEGRIQQHSDRVACMGVKLDKSFYVECLDDEEREQGLINRCCESAAQRFQLEWFTGLDFDEVCKWANKAALTPMDYPVTTRESFGRRLREARIAARLLQGDVGAALGVGKACVSHWEVDRHSPSMSQLRALCEHLKVSADHLLGLNRTAP